ncbi:ricin B lectin domain-containing protein [Lactarius quietus]|nr:ricin B lectin domain-containing protein [Lactarius quietus]
MSIKSGQRYTITNEENGLALDLFESHDNSIIGSGFHGAENQQWITMHQDDGQWTIQSVSTQKSYLGFKNTPKDGTPLFGRDKPQLWDIEILSDSEDHDNFRARFWVRDTLLVIEDPKKEGRNRAWPLELWAAHGGKNQVWVFEECS